MKDAKLCMTCGRKTYLLWEFTRFLRVRMCWRHIAKALITGEFVVKDGR